MTVAIRVCVAVGAALTVMSVIAPSALAAGTYGYQHKGTKCVTRTTSGGVQQQAAVTKWKMSNTAGSGNHIQEYRWKARLVPESPGINWHRAWSEVSTRQLSFDGANAQIGTVGTHWVGASTAWNLQIKLTWDRVGERDWNFSLNAAAFNESNCQGGTFRPLVLADLTN